MTGIARVYPEESTGEMRERAEAARGELATLKLRCMSLDREADQLEHEARLWDAVYDAEDLYDDETARRPGLEAALEGAIAAELAAAERARKDRGALSRAEATEKRLAGTRADADAQADAAVRVHKLTTVALESKEAHDRTAAVLQQAEDALRQHEQAAARLEASYAGSCQAARNPGTAPRTSPLQLGLGRPEDMTEQEKALIGTVALLSGGITTGKPESPARPGQAVGGWNWRGDLARADPSKARVIRQGRSSIIIPPVPAPGR